MNKSEAPQGRAGRVTSPRQTMGRAMEKRPDSTLKRSARLALLLLLLLGLLAGPAAGATALTGIFTATERCPAYQSKNKGTNPGNVETEPGRSYPLLQGNRPQNPDWYRIEIDRANPPQRWVAARCGTVADAAPGVAPGLSPRCDIAGQADHFVLALSWQPTFCADRPRRPECRARAWDHPLTLHGLWPNRRACGTRYGFCDPRFSHRSRPRNHCDYPPVPMTEATRARLGEVMPSTRAGGCLQRHQWYKHGSCQRRWSADDYFEIAIHWTEEVRRSPFGALLETTSGKASLAALRQSARRAFGEEGARRITFHCKQGRLKEIRITLPAAEPLVGQPLPRLLAAAPVPARGNCGPRITLPR